MEDGRPSTTALLVATSRARHQVDDSPKVFDDPLALRIVGEARAAGVHGADTLLERRLRGWMVARSRIAEDALHAAVERDGATQYVQLGAGLDTFAYRSPYSASALRVFEVDHPDTQAWKRKCLADANIDVPESLRFVPMNFETGHLGDALKAAGLRNDRPTFFSMLGVTLYIRHESWLQTMRFVASFPEGSGVAFDGMFRPHPFDLPGRLLLALLSRRFARMGEPWITYFDRDALPHELRRTGFSRVESLTAKQINDRFFSRRKDGLEVGGRLGCMIVARV